MNKSFLQGKANMTADEYREIDANIAKVIAETAKINEEILRSIEERMKIAAETKKINKETFWYPLLIASGLVGGIATITAIALKILHFL